MIPNQTGSFSLWSLLIQSNYLGGQWEVTDWLTHVVIGKKQGGLDKLQLPLTRDHLIEKYRLSSGQARLLLDLTFWLQSGQYSNVRTTASEALDKPTNKDIATYLEWFMSSVNGLSDTPGSVSKQIQDRDDFKSALDQLQQEDIGVVNTIFDYVTRFIIATEERNGDTHGK